MWAYNLPPLALAFLIIGSVVSLSLLGLVVTRRYLLPSLDLVDGVNDAVGGTVQAIGVFYGITVGLIAANVWTTFNASNELVSREAACISQVHRDVSALPAELKQDTQGLLVRYARLVIEDDWPNQRQGRRVHQSGDVLRHLEKVLYTFEPKTAGQRTRYQEALASFNRLMMARHLRVDAVHAGLSPVMWSVIWLGAGISIGVVYFYQIPSPKLHALLVTLTATLLGLLLFMLVVNDKPFFGAVGVTPQSYQLVLESMLRPTSRELQP